MLIISSKSMVLDKFYAFGKLYNVHVIIVAHPTKMKKDKDGNYPVATLKDISGSANFENKTDNGVSVYRDIKSGKVMIHIQKIRWQEFIGKLGMVEFEFDDDTSRYKENHQKLYESEMGDALIPEEHRTVKVPPKEIQTTAQMIPGLTLLDNEWNGEKLDIDDDDMPF